MWDGCSSAQKMYILLPVTVGQTMAHAVSQVRLMHPLGGVGASSVGKGPDSPSDSSTVVSPVGLNLSALAGKIPW